MELETSRHRSLYPAYRQTDFPWLGQIPVHWESKRLKNIAELNAESLPETTRLDYVIQYIDIGKVEEIEGIGKVEEMRFEDAPSRARRIVRQGNTIISTVRTYLKSIAYFDHPTSNLIVSTGFAVLKPMLEIDPKYLYMLVKCNEFVEQVVTESVGVSYPAISPSKLASLPTWVPPLPEQQAIAKYLDENTAKIDSLIAKKQRLLELLAEQRTALISQAVTKGLNPDAEMKESGVPWLGSVPSHWKIKPLFALLREHEQRNAGDEVKNVLSLSYGRIVQRDVESNFGLLPESFETYNVVSRGDIVLRLTDLQNDKRSLRVGLVTQNGIVTSAYLCLRNKGEIDCEYAYLLLHCYDVLKVFYTLGGGVRQTMRFEDLKHMPLMMPPISEQRQIARQIRERTERLERLTGVLVSAIKVHREYRAALISSVVTGKIRVD